MKYFAGLIVLLLNGCTAFGQGFLGLPKDSILQANHGCVAMNNYPEMLVLNCSGLQSIFYFNGKDSACDMYAMDITKENTDDILKKLPGMGFSNTGAQYMEPFLVSKHLNHQKFLSTTYANKNIQYCFIPVSLNGKLKELNSLIIMYVKGK